MDQGLTFHHIGIACRNIEKTQAFYEAMGYHASPVVDDPVQHVKVVFLDRQGEPRLELLEPLDEHSPVNRTLQSNGVTPYHICYAVEDINATIHSLRSRRFILVNGPVPACAMHGKLVAFMYHKDMGLIELVETHQNG